MASRPNWYTDLNPFGLARPPQWFLDELALFDRDLLIVPSRQEPVYRLMRRTTHTAGVRAVATLQSAPDTRMAATYSAVPVTSVFPGLGQFKPWTRTFFTEMASRDVWRHGGAAKATDAVEQSERDRRAAQDRTIADEATARAVDAYTAFQLRTGSAVGYRRPPPPANTTGGGLVRSGVTAPRPAPQLVVATS